VASSQAEGKSFRREIELDFLRGIAILMVLDFHQGDYGLLSYPSRWIGIRNPGWMGVSVFFVLSGFLVGGLLVKEWKVRGKIESGRFLIRRGFKIWPQYYFFLALMLATGHRTVRELWGNLLNIQNYVGGVAHTWSLAVEEHAYLFIVLCLVLAARWKVQMRSLFAFFAMSAISVSLLRLYLIRNGHEYFTPTHTRIDGILYGVLLAILYHYAPETFHRMQARWWIWLGALVVVLLILRFDIGWWEPSVSLDLGDVVGIALLMLLYRHKEGKRHSMAYRLVAWIGLYSYGIYLWHVSVGGPIVAVGRHIGGWTATVWGRVAPAIAGIALGFITTKLIEFPALRLRDRLFPRRVDSAVGTPAELEAPESGVQQA
jgi:peptidoglycan/LPS O-acetylase OafA/YrhL